jgi:hypothetical protein
MNEYECDECGATFERYPSQVRGENQFCSKDCQNGWQKGRDAPEDHNFRKNGKTEYECDYCGEVNKDYPSIVAKGENNFCDKDCAGAYRSEQGVDESHNFYKGGPAIVNCAWCDAELERRPCKLDRSEKFFCGDGDCEGKYKSKHVTGEYHPNWKGGYVEYYGSNWNRQRRKALARDNYECQVCGDGKDKLGRNPDVHHIVPVKTFENREAANVLGNLITLCRTHHERAERGKIECPTPQSPLQPEVAHE